jgi:hypothetical protein
MQPETLWEKLKQSIKESAATAAVKAEHLGKLGRARLDLAHTRNAIHNAFAELGAQVYHLIEQNPDMLLAQHETVQTQINAIKNLEEQLKNQEIAFKNLQETAAS